MKTTKRLNTKKTYHGSRKTDRKVTHTKESFYGSVADVLGVSENYVEAMPYRRRWGQRTPGNGRFEGFGLVRWFGNNLIHVSLEGHGPRVFSSPDEALVWIEENKG
jgi:hypothetical protein